MTFAIDSNVILDVIYNDPKFAQASLKLLTAAAADGNLVACDIVWAETSMAFSDKTTFKAIMDSLNIAFSPMTLEAAITAGEIWNTARLNLKRTTKTAKQVVIPDFLIGAHALACADALITRDRGFLRKWFGNLTVLDPTQA